MINKRNQPEYHQKQQNVKAKNNSLSSSMAFNNNSSFLNKQQSEKKTNRHHVKCTIWKISDGFIVDKNMLNQDLDCICVFDIENIEENMIHNEKQNESYFIKNKMQIAMNCANIIILKNSVKHTFSIPQDQNLFIKVIIGQNYSIEKLNIGQKRINFVNDPNNISQCTIVHPQELIQQSNKLRCIRINSDVKKPLSINWQSSKPQINFITPKKSTSKIISFNTNTNSKTNKSRLDLSRNSISSNTSEYQNSQRPSRKQNSKIEQHYPISHKYIPLKSCNKKQNNKNSQNMKIKSKQLNQYFVNIQNKIQQQKKQGQKISYNADQQSNVYYLPQHIKKQKIGKAPSNVSRLLPKNKNLKDYQFNDSKDLYSIRNKK